MNSTLGLIAQALDQAYSDAERLPAVIDGQDDAARFLIDLARVKVLVVGLVDRLASSGEAVASRLATALDAAERSTVRVDNGTVHLAESFTLTPNIDDLLPEGVDPKNPAYRDTVEGLRAHATANLIAAMKPLPAYSGLVIETYDEAKLAEELCGDEAPRNEGGVPIVPAALAPYVKVTRELDLALTDASGNEIGGAT